MQTIGISPKVLWPALLNLLIGFGLLIAGLVAGVEPIWGAGLGLLTGGGVTGAVGAAASPGTVTENIGTPSDEMLEIPDDA